MKHKMVDAHYIYSSIYSVDWFSFVQTARVWFDLIIIVVSSTL